MTAYLAAKAERLGMKHTGVTCQGCRQQINGVRHRCLDCDNFSLCGACVGSTWTRSAHPVHHAFFPIELPWDSDAFQQAFERRKTYNILAPDAPEHAGITCDGCNKGIVGIRHKCLSCPNFDYCTQCLSNPDERFMHDLAHAFLPVPKPGDLNQLLAVRAACQEPAPPVVHKGVACNECRDEIIGVRHRCLDCPDFDLCELCISRGAKQDHNSAHQFLELVKPGEVIVHTVYNNDQPGPQEQRANVQQQDTPVVHNATCNLCDSTIRGDRYKCLNCPDFDTCGACFNITSEQHPGHGFVRVDMDNQLIIRDARRLNVVYPVICDECHNPVRGIRYKCMHPSCPDYDLCQNCEALPISVHPITHPLLKVKTPEASIPSLLKKEEGECLKCKANSEAPLAIFTQATPAQEHQIIPTSDSTRRIEGLAEVVSVRHTDSHYRVPSCHISQPSNSSELSYANSEHHNMVAAPSLIPPWKPTNVDWHWHPTPPGPMVVPHMLSEESPALQTVVIPPCTLGQSVHSICSGDSPRSSFSEQSPFNPFRDANAVAHDVSVPPSESFSPPGLRTVAPLPMSPPPRLIDLDDPATKPVPEWLVEPATSEAQSATLAESSTSMPPLRTPSLEPELATEEWRTLVPEIGTLLKLLFKPPTPEVPSRSTTYMPGGMLAEDPTDLIESPPSEHEYRSAVESPLAAEALLSRPSAQIPEMVERPRTNGRSLTDFLGFSTLSRRSPADSPLVVTYLSHNNIADGQFFPPGAEFVKSWRMRNDGSEPWPETTQLVFIAGDRLSPYEGAASKVQVGYCDYDAPPTFYTYFIFKAPDTPGAYVSYWQLHDGQVGFGDLVWVDIVVAEVNDEAGEESLAASSVIMPPAPSAPSARTNTRESVVPSTFSTPSSDDGSFDSSMSLINVPSSPSGEDDDLYQDSRARIHASPLETHRDLEYVVLYDTASSEDE
ncbi:hypothetical protein EW026_g520 [Hermanssonia centrifuga]|uniref:ZZ-type domain-containing protein n=1 Tax=Hermanssonia centrifuga TaxID=98765 RepID=A0A4S4KUD4_9APHY|nr:hypothetical protein EW026_g520 [Hermanssonia centrifuga]